MKNSFGIDAIDRKIIAIVQRDSSVGHAELAEQVGASSASCWRRIRALEAAGVLVGSVRLADPVKLGCGVTVLCNVRINNHSRVTSTAFERFVLDPPEIVECFSMSGDWDYLLRIVAADVTDYNRFLTERILTHPSVAAASSHFALETIKYTTALPV